MGDDDGEAVEEQAKAPQELARRQEHTVHPDVGQHVVFSCQILFLGDAKLSEEYSHSRSPDRNEKGSASIRSSDSTRQTRPRYSSVTAAADVSGTRRLRHMPVAITNVSAPVSLGTFALSIPITQKRGYRQQKASTCCCA